MCTPPKQNCVLGLVSFGKKQEQFNLNKNDGQIVLYFLLYAFVFNIDCRVLTLLYFLVGCSFSSCFVVFFFFFSLSEPTILLYCLCFLNSLRGASLRGRPRLRICIGGVGRGSFPACIINPTAMLFYDHRY